MGKPRSAWPPVLVRAPYGVSSLFGVTSEIQKEITGRGLGLQPDQSIYEVRAPGF
jgi:hypothetical protein